MVGADDTDALSSALLVVSVTVVDTREAEAGDTRPLLKSGDESTTLSSVSLIPGAVVACVPLTDVGAFAALWSDPFDESSLESSSLSVSESSPRSPFRPRRGLYKPFAIFQQR